MFGQIIVQAKLMKLLMPLHNSLNIILQQKPLFELKTQRSCTTCCYPWPKYLALGQIISPLSIKFRYARQWSRLSYFSFEDFSKTNSAMKNPTLSELKVYNQDCQSSKTTMQKPQKFNQKIYSKTKKMRRVYSSIMTLSN